ncbi:ribosomal RNA processing protein 1 homolog A-like isoform X2 [Odontomachus brunneus]|uniref:ribosomal RNA processing protein 1 homolog A-like isoform X2 n=1 Tax=Odontomachus brunneus TaxID=486640 RepID=UPI0013F25BC6|nr:ribosomal RNA processing protein 1 homolog A-like isoform X2 [Odontomachus brunneus]
MSQVGKLVREFIVTVLYANANIDSVRYLVRISADDAENDILFYSFACACNSTLLGLLCKCDKFRGDPELIKIIREILIFRRDFEENIEDMWEIIADVIFYNGLTLAGTSDGEALELLPQGRKRLAEEPPYPNQATSQNSGNDTGASETVVAAAGADDGDDDENDNNSDDNDSADSNDGDSNDSDDDDDDGDYGNVPVVTDSGNDVNVGEGSGDGGEDKREERDDDNTGGNVEDFRRYREFSSTISEPSYLPVSHLSYEGENYMPHIPDTEREEEWERILRSGNIEIPRELRIFPDSPYNKERALSSKIEPAREKSMQKEVPHEHGNEFWSVEESLRCTTDIRRSPFVFV